MPERTAILKGWALWITYTDGSRSHESFDYQDGDYSKLQSRVKNLMNGQLESVAHYSVHTVYSEPGETIKLKVKH
jgi:hypothetical protein